MHRRPQHNRLCRSHIPIPSIAQEILFCLDRRAEGAAQAWKPRPGRRCKVGSFRWSEIHGVQDEVSWEHEHESPATNCYHAAPHFEKIVCWNLNGAKHRSTDRSSTSSDERGSRMMHRAHMPTSTPLAQLLRRYSDASDGASRATGAQETCRSHPLPAVHHPTPFIRHSHGRLSPNTPVSSHPPLPALSFALVSIRS
nr:hypothetical protein CFP56_57682 [Quercus suber]